VPVRAESGAKTKFENARAGGWQRPETVSLRLLPSGPDRVGECLVRRQPPGPLYQTRTPPRQDRLPSLYLTNSRGLCPKRACPPLPSHPPFASLSTAF